MNPYLSKSHNISEKNRWWWGEIAIFNSERETSKISSTND